MYMTLFMFVGLLFVADIICATELKVEPLEIGASGKIPFDHIVNDPEVRQVQWYKSRRRDEFQNDGPSLAWWTERETGSLPNYHLENTTFSLVIAKATLEDEGLYKCFVTRGDLFVESNYFIRTIMYALPQKHPVITLDAELNRVNCTVEHVKPLIYPVFNFAWSPESTETYAALNENGTYTTSVCCPMPQTKIVSRVDCSFSYLNYQGVGSLDLHYITTDNLIENITPTVSPIGPSVKSAGDGSRAIHYSAIIVWVIFSLLIVAIIIIISVKYIELRKKYHRVVQGYNKDKKSEEIMIQPATGMEADVVVVALLVNKGIYNPEA